jgi:ferrous iron transport protein A
MDETLTTLDALPVGQTGQVETVAVEGPLRRRLQELGLIAGTRVRCLQRGPWGDPAAYLVRGAVLALRREDARHIRVRT